MHQICRLFILPLTAPRECSFTELVAVAAQPPNWFCSHFWGTAFQCTVMMVNFHAQSHGLNEETAYWLCPFANNQHDLTELGGEVMETPFARAILHKDCTGTLVLCDGNASPMMRAWCILELFVTTQRAPHKRFDISAMIDEGAQRYGNGHVVPAGPALRMDLGNGRAKEMTSSGEGWFPDCVALAGAQMNVVNAKATLPRDRDAILRILAGIEDDSSRAPTTCERYEKVNVCVRRRFLPAAIYKLAMDGDADGLRSLLACEPEIDSQRADGETALFQAAGKGHDECVDLLLSAGAQVNIADDDGFTSLIKATWQGHESCVRLLLLAKAAVSHTTKSGLTALRVAVERKRDSCLKLLRQASSGETIALPRQFDGHGDGEHRQGQADMVDISA